MNILFDGIKVGLILAIMTGPIFFALLQTGVEEGFRAGSMVGLGIWTSDILYISSVYFGISYITQVIESDSFTLTFGIVGSVLLVIFGLGALLTQPKNLYLSDDKQYKRSSSYLSLWLRGFLLNAVNPFTLFFWMGLMSTAIINNHLNGPQSVRFFIGIMLTVIVTDLLKVLLAKRIRSFLKPLHLIWLRKISGAALIAFGVALLIRAIVI